MKSLADHILLQKRNEWQITDDAQNDWQQMQGLLDMHMPVATPPAASILSHIAKFKLLSAVVATITAAAVVYFVAHRIKVNRHEKPLKPTTEQNIKLQNRESDSLTATYKPNKPDTIANTNGGNNNAVPGVDNGNTTSATTATTVTDNNNAPGSGVATNTSVAKGTVKNAGVNSSGHPLAVSPMVASSNNKLNGGSAPVPGSPNRGNSKANKLSAMIPRVSVKANGANNKLVNGANVDANKTHYINAGSKWPGHRLSATTVTSVAGAGSKSDKHRVAGNRSGISNIGAGNSLSSNKTLKNKYTGISPKAGPGHHGGASPAGGRYNQGGRSSATLRDKSNTGTQNPDDKQLPSNGISSKPNDTNNPIVDAAGKPQYPTTLDATPMPLAEDQVPLITPLQGIGKTVQITTPPVTPATKKPQSTNPQKLELGILAGINAPGSFTAKSQNANFYGSWPVDAWLGIFANYNLNQRWGINIQPKMLSPQTVSGSYSHIAVSKIDSGKTFTVTDSRKIYFVDVPLHLVYNATPNLSLMAGASISFPVKETNTNPLLVPNSALKDSTYYVGVKQTITTTKYSNQPSFGLSGGISLHYWRLYLNATYLKAFNPQSVSSTLGSYTFNHDVLQFSLGFRFK